MKQLIIVVCIFMLTFIVVVAIGCGETKTADELQAEIDQELAEIEESAIDKQEHNGSQQVSPRIGEWVEVANFSGSGSKQTGPFNINSRSLRLRWSANTNRRDNMIIHLLRTDGTYTKYMVNVLLESSMADESYAYGLRPGTYYLDIIGTDSWTIAVDQQN